MEIQVNYIYLMEYATEQKQQANIYLFEGVYEDAENDLMEIELAYGRQSGKTTDVLED